MSHATYHPPPELVELGDIFRACHEQVARSLHVEPHLAGPLDSQKMIGDALTEMTAALREWYADNAPAAQRRVTPEAAAELEALVHGGAAR